MNYYMIEMDLVDSRNITDRIRFQQELSSFFEDLSSTYKDSLLFPITIILGDEWRVACKNTKFLYPIYLKIAEFLEFYDLSCYAGFSCGQLNQPMDECSLLYGDAITRAEEALKIAKSSKNGYQKLVNKDCCIYASGFDHNELLNTLLQNNALLKQNLTKKQKEVIRLYETYGSISEILKHGCHLSKSTLSEHLSVSQYRLIKQNDEVLEALFQYN